MQRVRQSRFVFGLVCLLFAASFTFGDAGVRWMWQDTPVIGGGVLLAVSLFFWVLLALKASRRRGPTTR